MQINQITPDYSVSPQIEPSDMAQLAAAGFKTVICNRPDAEISGGLDADTMEKAAVAAGLVFVRNPVTHPTINEDTIGTQADAIKAATGPVLAYCASGTRSSILWSLSRVGLESADDILAATTKAGYDLSALRPRLG